MARVKLARLLLLRANPTLLPPRELANGELKRGLSRLLATISALVRQHIPQLANGRGPGM